MLIIIVMTSLKSAAQQLYNERRVELTFEEHRYQDVMRWEITMDGGESADHGNERYKKCRYWCENVYPGTIA